MKSKFCGASVLFLILGIFGFFGIIGAIVSGINVLNAVLSVLFYLYFAIILFMKKRGVPTFIALALFVVLAVINRNFFDFVAYALLFVLALSACDKRIIKTNFFKKINFVPGLLLVISFVVGVISAFVNMVPYIGFAAYIGAMSLSYVLSILEIIAVFVVGKWLAYPHGKGVAEVAAPAPAVEAEAEVKE